MFTIGFILGFVAGGALIWFCKDKVTSFYKSTEDHLWVHGYPGSRDYHQDGRQLSD
jgi:hypothetical protein